MKRGLPIWGHSQQPRPLGAARLQDAVRPTYCVWEVTLRCDLSCAHCGSRAGKPRADELNAAECLDVIRQLAELGVREVSLIGGEVYLRQDWEELVRAVRDAGMICGIVSGGRGFTRERARQAKAAGVSGVSISVDGLESAHDQLRALNGSYRAAMAALDALAAADVRRAANTQINRLSRDDLPELLERLIERRIYGWQPQITVAMGRAADRPEILLQPYELLDVIPCLASLAARCAEADVSFAPGNNVGYFGPHEAALRGHSARGHCQSCTAGRHTLGIEANGDVKGCPSLPSADYVGGNLRHNNLREIWEGAAALRFTRDRDTTELWGFCAGCYYAAECLAGCSWTSHVLFGRRGNNPYCHHRALELRDRGVRERLVPESRAPGDPFDFGEFSLIEEPWPA